jgi:MFS family permease
MMGRVKIASRNAFSSLQIRNFRLYFIGQGVSVSGTFMQAVALAWLVLRMTGSGTALGVVSALQFLPILLFAPLGGAIADRFPKRNLIIFTQCAFGILALLLGILVLTDLVQLWMVYGIALCLGLFAALDSPTRHTFVSELVGEKGLKNAITLNSGIMNVARIIGPTIAGILIAEVGIASCFIINGLSYVVVIVMLLLMKKEELVVAKREIGKSRYFDGLSYIFSKPDLRMIFIMIAVIGTLAYEFQVSLPLLAKNTFGGDARSYAALSSAFGLGAVIGGLLFAGKKHADRIDLARLAAFFGISLLAAAVSPNHATAVVMMVSAGIFSIGFTSAGNAMMQLGSTPGMRGRVMAFWSMAMMGSTAIGGPIIGWIGEYVGPRYALGLGGFATVLVALYAYLSIRRSYPESIFAFASAEETEEDGVTITKRS